MANDTRTGFGRVFAMGCLALVFLTLALAPAMMGQSASTGALAGQVKDASGAVVPNATVTLTNTGTAQTRTTKTTSDGNYKFGFLPPGSYRVRFEAAGFSTADVASVTVNVTETPVLDQTLSVGGQTTTVEVVGETQAVQTASSTVGTVVSGRTLSELPLTTRNYTNLLGLTSGANAAVFNATTMGRGTTDVAVNGSSIWQNNYQQDGASIVQSSGRGGAADSGANPGIGVVNPDAIGEYKIQTSGFDAGYGRNPGANVNVVTKSGTNQYHGTAFEFFRNTSLNANDYFRKQSPAPNNTRQRLDQHQFGGTFGGPVIKDKLFFFASFQETRQKNGLSPAGNANPTLLGIPTGDRSTPAFKAALGAAFCPGGSATIGGGASVAGTSVGTVKVNCNGSNINPVALNLLNLKNDDGSYYIPSSSTGRNQNVTLSIPAIYKEHQAVGNVDYLINNNNTFSGRYYFSQASTYAPMGCGATGTSVTLCLPGGPGQILFPTAYYVTKLTSILSNNVVNEVRASLQNSTADTQSLSPFTNSQVGIASIIPSYDLLDSITITSLMQLGGTVSQTYKSATAWQLADQISWSHGKHTTRAGLEYERDRLNWLFGGLSQGSLTFTNFQDFLLGLPGCAALNAACTTSTNAGLTNGSTSSHISSSGGSASITPPGGANYHYRATAANIFLQDDYKILSNLTLNLGIRWEYNGLITDEGGLLTNVWPNLINTVPVPGSTAATGSLAGFVVPANYNFALNPAPPVSGLYQNNKNIPTQSSPPLTSFAPRVGFAWKPLSTDRFVVRGGGGYFYDRMGIAAFNNAFVQSQPYTLGVFQAGTANYFSSFAQPYDANAKLGWAPRFVNLTTGASSNLNLKIMDPIYLAPVTYQWNMNVQYEFLPKWVLEVGYVGSRAIHQVPDFIPNGGFSSRQLNAAHLASAANPINGVTTNTTASSNINLRVPYLGFAPRGLASNQTVGDSKFNSLQVTVRKQFSHGLQMQAAYTLSRSNTTTGYFTFNDPNNLRYGPYAYYRPHRLAINYSYELPFGNHTGLLGKVANGWGLSGVTVIQNGTPLTISDTRGGAIYGFGPGAPQVSTAQYAAGKGPGDVATAGDVKQRLGGTTGGPGFFNASAFSTVPIVGATPGNSATGGTGWGNSGYGTVLGPGQVNFDATLQKTTRVGGLREDANLIFRTEFFNLFNHAQFSNPTGGQLQVNSSTFGQITSTSVNPRLIQFALKYVF